MYDFYGPTVPEINYSSSSSMPKGMFYLEVFIMCSINVKNTLFRTFVLQ